MLGILQSVLSFPTAIITHIIYEYTKPIKEKHYLTRSEQNESIINSLTIINQDDTCAVDSYLRLLNWKSDIYRELIETTFSGHYPITLEVYDNSARKTREMNENIIESIIKKYGNNILNKESSKFTFDVKIHGYDYVHSLYHFVLYNNKIYVANFLGHCIDIYDKYTYKKINTINKPRMGYVRDIAIFNDEIYVPEASTNKIYVFDADTLQFIRIIECKTPYMIVVTQDKLYCSSYSNIGSYNLDLFKRS